MHFLLYEALLWGMIVTIDNGGTTKHDHGNERT